MLKLCKLHACANGTLGLHLSRAPWDPYPWVSGVQEGSSAQRAGVRSGDTVLELNGRDVLGQRIAQIAEHISEHWKSGATHVTVVIWRNQPDSVTSDDNQQRDNAVKQNQHEQHEQHEQQQQHQQQQHQQQQSINQQSLQKFATCLQRIAQLLECPVCLEVIRPPGWQCCNGHVLCNNCRSRSAKCPVCRVPLGPRGRCLMSDKLFTLLAESFPCERVKDNSKTHNDSNTNKNNASPGPRPGAEISKCSQDFHNRATIATACKDKSEAKMGKRETRNQIKRDVAGEESWRRTNAEPTTAVASRTRTSSRDSTTSNGRLQLEEQQISRSHLWRKFATSSSRNESGELYNASDTDSNSSNSSNNSYNSNNSYSYSNNNSVDNSNALSLSSEDESYSASDRVDGRAQRVGGVVGEEGQLRATGVSNSIRNNKDDNDDNVIDKLELKLKSNEKIAGCWMDETTEGNNHSNNNNVIAEIIAINVDKQDENNNNNNNNGNNCSNKKASRTGQEIQVEGAVATTTTATAITRLIVQQQQQQQQQHEQQQQPHRDYYCPTGKSRCCYVQPSTATTVTSAAAAAAAETSAMNECLSTTLEINDKSNNVGHTSEILIKEEERNAAKVSSNSADSTIRPPTTSTSSNNCNLELATATTPQRFRFRNAWQLFAHLTQVHGIPVAHYEGAFGSRIAVRFMHSKSALPCLTVCSSESADGRNSCNQQQQQQFLVARVPLLTTTAVAAAAASSGGAKSGGGSGGAISQDTAKYAVFLWHLNHPTVAGSAAGSAGAAAADDDDRYESIIESRRTGVRWFGSVHPLTRSWRDVRAEGHFLLHSAAARQMIAVEAGRAKAVAAVEGDDDDDFFDIVINIKKQETSVGMTTTETSASCVQYRRGTRAGTNA